jgi:hypothetical protein
MDLVPILTTIILVGTMATLMLVIFTYSLYKVRGRRIQARQERRDAISRRRRRSTLKDASGTPRASLGEPTEALMYVPPTATASPKETAVVDDHHGGAGADEMERAGGVELPAQDVENASSEFSSREDALFWEYTGEGFVPVDPSTSASQTGVHARHHADQENEGCAWL